MIYAMCSSPRIGNLEGFRVVQLDRSIIFGELLKSRPERPGNIQRQLTFARHRSTLPTPNLLAFYVQSFCTYLFRSYDRLYVLCGEWFNRCRRVRHLWQIRG